MTDPNRPSGNPGEDYRWQHNPPPPDANWPYGSPHPPRYGHPAPGSAASPQQWQYSPPPYPAAPPYQQGGYPSGYPMYPAPYVPLRQPSNGIAVAAMIVGLTAIPFTLLGLLIGFVGLLGLLLSVIGIVLGAVALSQLKRNPQGGRGMALTGLIAGSVCLVVCVLVFTLVLVWISHGYGHVR